MAYDPECLKLAEYFTNDLECGKKVTAAQQDDLAKWIQQAIEDWFSNESMRTNAQEEHARDQWVDRKIDERGFA